MKEDLRILFGFLALILLTLTSVQAGVFYSDDFNGPAAPANLDAFAPDVRPSNEQWQSASNIYADGSCATGHASAWLPIECEDDQVYTVTLHMDVVYASGSATPGGGLALTTADTYNTGRPNNLETRGFLEFGRSGSWAFYDMGAEPAIASGGNNSLFTESQTDYEVRLVLTTSSTESWKLDAYLGGVQMDLAPSDAESLSYTYSSPPVLTGAGLYIVSGTCSLVDFELQAPVDSESVEVTSRVVDVFLLAGQSNMSGRVTTDYIHDSRDDECLFYYRTDGPASSDVDSGGAFTTVQPLASGYYGPEISLSRELVDKGYRVAIIKVSDGGTSLDVDWNTTSCGTWWKHWRSEVACALEGLETMGYVIRVRGGCWLQGETDAANATRAANYENNFSTFLADLNSQLTDWGYDTSDMLTVCALIRTASGTYAGTVRTAQQTVIEGQGNATWFDTDDLSMQGDNLHYDAAGIATLGERFAAAFPGVEDFDAWTSGNGLSGDDALPTADADGNGLDNLTEYALGIDHGGTLEEPVAEVLETVLSVTAPLLRQDIAYLPEWSENLVQWFSDGLTVERSLNEVVAQKSRIGYERLFMRLSMELE
ncbi:sialate O-acetylesterase [Coraliomargarita parva]|uniref:sialate O-acetylesterase n=1 Tax=Coraliomargarita parva TaxID=3014050 RepID=UPI0022B59C5A|nr:sialate O-acetylesterase [Coraliomargarita parva]